MHFFEICIKQKNSIPYEMLSLVRMFIRDLITTSGHTIIYFAGGREIALLNRAFLFVPMPLAVFPVLYFLCAAVWLHNLPAVILMTIFGAAHLTVSIQSFR